MTLAADGNVAAMLSDFGGDPQRAEDLAEFLRFQPISNPKSTEGMTMQQRNGR